MEKSLESVFLAPSSFPFYAYTESIQMCAMSCFLLSGDTHCKKKGKKGKGGLLIQFAPSLLLVVINASGWGLHFPRNKITFLVLIRTFCLLKQQLGF